MKPRSWSRPFALGTLLVGLSVVVAACGGSTQPSSPSSSQAPPASKSSQATPPAPPQASSSSESPAPPVSTPASSAATAPPISSEPAGEVVEVVATDEGGQFRFEPADVSVSAGQTVTIRIVNKGPSAHDWAMPDLKVETGQFASGEVRTVTFTAPAKPGEYGILCTVPGHSQLGMQGKLIVR